MKHSGQWVHNEPDITDQNENILVKNIDGDRIPLQNQSPTYVHMTLEVPRVLD